ncbi:hypothetical protein PLEOSDRAFT_154189 [Pleurotus ostreatus PC15]|uniref:Transmembrane protein n=1 Tax=Pleurotus ostreatus (strain PC15) TaxID=1137138 RepID=A0A067NV90_PLEO1|nr:hypothetical protein PLEOSDRAFT_154189 [Pleurotus ostreatus PC15]
MPNSPRLHATRSHSVLRYAFVIALSVALIYLGSVASNGEQTPSTASLTPSQGGQAAMVDGRWKTVRKSLGLPLLPLGQLRLAGSTQQPKSKSSTFGLRYNLQLTSRFNLRHKREFEEAKPDLPITPPTPPALFFTEEALDEPTISYSAFLKSLQMASESSGQAGNAKAKAKGTLQKNEGKKTATPRWFKRDD